jgi:hypothetical protein
MIAISFRFLARSDQNSNARDESRIAEVTLHLRLRIGGQIARVRASHFVRRIQNQMLSFTIGETSYGCKMYQHTRDAIWIACCTPFLEARQSRGPMWIRRGGCCPATMIGAVLKHLKRASISDEFPFQDDHGSTAEPAFLTTQP